MPEQQEQQTSAQMPVHEVTFYLGVGARIVYTYSCYSWEQALQMGRENLAALGLGAYGAEYTVRSTPCGPAR